MQSPLILLAGFSIDVSQNPERNPECVWVMGDEIAGFIWSEEVENGMEKLKAISDKY